MLALLRRLAERTSATAATEGFFRVAPVKNGDKTFNAETFSDTATSLLNSMATEDQWADRTPDSKLHYETGLTNHALVDTESQIRHGFINAVITAYNHHLPLVLSPDDLWLLISLTVATFLGTDKRMAEKYRHVFVDHEGKKELVVPTSPRPVNELMKDKAHWNAFIEVICQMVADETKTDIAAIMLQPFSTTGTIEKAVMGITLMEAMKNYFDYTCMTLCGIPEVKLEGTVEDYQSIILRVQKLAPLLPDLKRYFDRVAAHLSKILKTKEGSIDVGFWRKMVSLKEEHGSGKSPLEMDGWFKDFLQCHGAGGRYDLYGNRDKFALTRTPFKIKDNAKDGKVYAMTLCGGFVGCSQDPSTKAVRPAIGWLLFFNDQSEDA